MEELNNLTPRHISMLAWALVRMNYNYKPYKESLRAMTNKIMKFSIDVYRVYIHFSFF